MLYCTASGRTPTQCSMLPMYEDPFQLQLSHSVLVPLHLGSCHACCPERLPHTSASRSPGQSVRAPALPPVVSLPTHPLMVISAPSKLAEPWPALCLIRNLAHAPCHWILLSSTHSLSVSFMCIELCDVFYGSGRTLGLNPCSTHF